jgi:hypothetical protein
VSEERERKLFTWPAEPTDDLVRDSVMMAGKYISDGNWRAALETVRGMRAWSLVHSCDRER